MEKFTSQNWQPAIYQKSLSQICYCFLFLSLMMRNVFYYIFLLYSNNRKKIKQKTFHSILIHFVRSRVFFPLSFILVENTMKILEWIFQKTVWKKRTERLSAQRHNSKFCLAVNDSRPGRQESSMTYEFSNSSATLSRSYDRYFTWLIFFGGSVAVHLSKQNFSQCYAR